MPHAFVLRAHASLASTRVLVARGALDRLGREIRPAFPGRRIALITDARVGALYGTRALRALERAGLAPELLAVPAGERSKSAARLAFLWNALAGLGLDRDDAIVALGGGVVGDLAGFAAATFLRGVAWIGVPTTVVAQADSAIGGKTGIDLPAGKNLAGAFHAPAVVIADPELLATLPERHRRAGLAEAIKCGMAVDASLFRTIERDAGALERGDPQALERAVFGALSAKARVVRSDPFERTGRRAALNYGHTLGHAIETCLGYRRLHHGEAVAIGMRVAAALSVLEVGLPERDRGRQDALLDRLRLPSRIPGLGIDELQAAMSRDKKRRNGRIRWVLTPRMGHASVPRLIAERRLEAVLIEAGARR